jgi:NADH dehydrogenase
MNPTPTLHAVTGASGYTGRYLAARLLSQGKDVITLTGSPDRPSPFGERVRTFPFDFDHPERLAASLKGVRTLYNTYWVRFNHGEATFQRAVRNTKILVDAAVQAGVRRLVHVSITNPALGSPLPYFHGKAELEAYIRASGLSHAILRPAVIFGREDILLNNIAWFLRRFPVFGIPGDGSYRLQPIFVDDMAALMAQYGEGDENVTVDATGPETFTFDELVRELGDAVGKRVRLVHLPPGLALTATRLVGLFVRDVVLTRDEVRGLMENTLVTDSPPVGTTKLSAWARENAAWLGSRYHSELARHFLPV